MAISRTIILLAALCALAASPPAAVTAQTPGGNAAGGQYLPSVPGGDGNRDESRLEGNADGERPTGLKAGFGSARDAGTGISVALPIVLLLSLLAVLGYLVYSRAARRGAAPEEAGRGHSVVGSRNPAKPPMKGHGESGTEGRKGTNGGSGE